MLLLDVTGDSILANILSTFNTGIVVGMRRAARAVATNSNIVMV